MLPAIPKLRRTYEDENRQFLQREPSRSKEKLRLPDQLELVMEDGTVYRVRSFFVAEQQMGDVLDALSLEKVNREN